MEDRVAPAQQEWQAAHDAYGPRHESTLVALLALAEARRLTGDGRGAVRDAGEVLAVRIETLGAEHPETLAVASLVGIWRHNLGDVGAVDSLRELVPVMTRVLGAEQPYTLLAQHVVTAVDSVGADPAVRLVNWVRLCGAETRVFGVWHEVTLEAVQMVAAARRDLGDPFGASSDALTAYDYRRQLLGDAHPNTLSAQLARLTWLGEATGITDFILDGLAELVPAMQNTFGHDDVNTLTARFTQTAYTPKSADNEVEWISEWESLFADLVRVLGEEHQLTVAARDPLSQARIEWQSSLDATREIAFDLFVDMESEERDVEKVADRDWMDTGNLDDELVDQVADDADEQRSERVDLMESVVAAKIALSASARTRGDNARETLQWRYYVAWCFFNGHEFETAGRRTRRLIEDCVRVLGEHDPLTTASRELLSFIDSRAWAGLSPFWDGSASA
ncbi:hypothetical protein A5647_22835 [Mycobacterium sp. 1100029.7]|nr:hypothetical protein A5647_22835 [Mycobacterium sp. 1100029.7]